MPEVTVLTAVRNGTEFLPETIDSIRKQNFDDWEYILVDDASTDDTPRLIEKFAKTDPRIKLIRRTQPGGPFLAATQGLKHANGKYIIRTDGDDVSLPNRINCQLNFLKARPNLRACATFCQALTDAGPIPIYHTSPLTSGVLKWYLSLRCNLVHSSACVEREALIQTYSQSPLAPVYEAWGKQKSANSQVIVPDVEDYRMWCNLARLDWLAVIPEVMVYFRRHQKRVSVIRAVEQRKLAIDVIKHHTTTLTTCEWEQDNLEALYAVGHAELFKLSTGLKALNLWDQNWLNDPSLNTSERKELNRLSAFRRKKFMRANAKRQPASFLRHLFNFLQPAPVNVGFAQ